MSNSKMVGLKMISPFKTCPRTEKITKITVHHMAGVLTAKKCGEIFQTRQASSNYGIGSDGIIGMYVEEKDRSWCSSSSWNDNRAVTIEVSNSKAGGDWPISDRSWGLLVDLCVDICKRNGMKELKWTGDKDGSLTCHYMFAATACPGPFLKARMPELAKMVTQRLKDETVHSGTGEKQKDEGDIFRVQVGAFAKEANAKKMLEEVKKKGFDAFVTKAGNLYKVQVGAFAKEANAEAQLKKMKAAGFSDAFIAAGKAKKTVEELAKEVIQGKWGSGETRKKALTAAGYDYEVVQKRVNQILGF